VVVAAIPRGGAVVALPIAERLAAPLTIAYAHKLSSPLQPEFAFGAVDEDGEVILDEAAVGALGLNPDDIARATLREREEIRRRVALYGAPPVAGFLPQSAVILVDDGLATGLTMRAALVHARRHGAARVVVATPCASSRAAEAFQEEADLFVGLIVDRRFMAVGDYYVEFPQVPDEAVTAILERAKAITGTTGDGG